MSKTPERNRFVTVYYYDENNKIIRQEYLEVTLTFEQKEQRIIIEPAHAELDKMFELPHGAKKGQIVFNFVPGEYDK